MKKQTFINKAEKIHGKKYDYSKVEYKAYDSEVTVICPKHGEFKIMPHLFLKGYGCPMCTQEKVNEKLNDVFRFDENDEWVTKEECIKKVGVSRPTFEAWMRQRLFTYKVYNKTLRISKSSFERFVNETWDTYQESKDAKESLKLQKDIYGKELEALSIKANIFRWFSKEHSEEFLRLLLRAAAKTLPTAPKKRDLEITGRLLGGEDISALADEYQMTESNIRILFMGLIKSFKSDDCRSYDELIADIHRKELQLSKQRTHITILSSENKKLAKEAGKARNYGTLKKLLEVDDNSLSSRDFSNRTINAMRMNGIKTIVDFTSMTRYEVLRLPRMGRRAYDEIQTAMKKYGLSFRKTNE